MSWVPREGDEHTSPVGVEMVVILPALLPLTAVSSGHVWAVQARSIGFTHPATTGTTEHTCPSTILTGKAQFHKAMGHGMIQKQANTFGRNLLGRC